MSELPTLGREFGPTEVQDGDLFLVPLGRLCLIEVLEEEDTTPGGLLVVEDERRSLQGRIVAMSQHVSDERSELVLGDRVIFDDNETAWFRGADPSKYLSILLGEEPEFVFVPDGQILAVIEEDDQ